MPKIVWTRICCPDCPTDLQQSSSRALISYRAVATPFDELVLSRQDLCAQELHFAQIPRAVLATSRSQDEGSGQRTGRRDGGGRRTHQAPAQVL